MHLIVTMLTPLNARKTRVQTVMHSEWKFNEWLIYTVAPSVNFQKTIWHFWFDAMKTRVLCKSTQLA